jgi:hypothetical protein
MASAMVAALPKLMAKVFSCLQSLRMEVTSKWYWRNWLLVEATCLPHRDMLVKVSSPLNSNHEEPGWTGVVWRVVEYVQLEVMIHLRS